MAPWPNCSSIPQSAVPQTGVTYIARHCHRKARSTNSAAALLRPKYSCVGALVLHSVRPSVCPAPMIYSKSKCRRNITFIGHLLQDTNYLDSHMFHD